jgi:hypothetical protein
MKRLFSLLMIFSLLISLPALAAQAAEPLTLAEIEQFNQGLLSRAIAEGLKPVKTEEGWQVRGELYELLLGSQDLSKDTLVLGAALSSLPHEGEEAVKGPRGTLLDMSQDGLLALFPSDNPYLSGTEDAAVLYMSGMLPAAVMTGFVLRDGQRLMLAEYDVYFQTDAGVSRAGLQFTLEEGRVYAIRSFVGEEPLSQEEALKELENLGGIQEQSAYIAYGSVEGTQLAREDFVLSGLDFFEATREMASALFGAPDAEVSARDGAGSLVTLQWPGLEAVFRVEGKTERLERLTVSSGQAEGPRGLRIGDSLAQAISRFEHGTELPAEGGALYGDPTGQVPPYGMLIPGVDDVRLYYAIGTENGTAAMMLTFVEDLLVSLSLAYL